MDHKRIKISSINDYLFDSIFIKIFGYLNGGQCRICRQVCKKWNEIFMNDINLKKHWECLFLKRMITLEDINFIMNSELKFTNLVTRGEILNCFPVFVMKDFWIYLGKTVKILSFLGFAENEFLNLLKWLPSLEKLKFVSVKKVIHPPNGLFLMNLKEIYFQNYADFQNVRLLMGICPKLEILDYSTPYINEVKSILINFKSFPRYWKTLTWIDYQDDFKKFTAKFLEMKELNVEYLIYHADSDFKSLSNIMRVHPKIKSAMIQFKNLNNEKIEEVLMDSAVNHKIEKIECTGTMQNLSLIAKFLNVQEINFTLACQSCPIDHENIPRPSIKKLILRINRLTCEECFKSLNGTFTSVEKLTFFPLETTDYNLPQLLHNWKNLRDLRITASFNVYLHFYQPMPRLKILFLKSQTNMDNLVNLFTVVPNLEILIYCIFSASTYTLLSGYLCFLPNIRTLDIYVSSLCILDDEDVENMIISISNHLKKLKVLSIPVSTRILMNSDGFARFLFESLPKLEHIKFAESNSYSKFRNYYRS
uniref:CSON006229 protein n=1 Tax=Culicoides sonorensis TaxID=179676 RepID=A0A336L7S0_CULSO